MLRMRETKLRLAAASGPSPAVCVSSPPRGCARSSPASPPGPPLQSWQQPRRAPPPQAPASPWRRRSGARTPSYG
eukprot:1185647-Prorocentrum_minimum.AAC.2